METSPTVFYWGSSEVAAAPQLAAEGAPPSVSALPSQHFQGNPTNLRSLAPVNVPLSIPLIGCATARL